jgi:hypothetical protein
MNQDVVEQAVYLESLVSEWSKFLKNPLITL